MTNEEKNYADAIRIPGGNYVTLNEYAKREGITRVGARWRVDHGKVKTIKIGRILIVKVAE